MTLQDLAIMSSLAVATSGGIGVIFKYFHDRNADAHGGVMTKVVLATDAIRRMEYSMEILVKKMDNFQQDYWQHNKK